MENLAGKKSAFILKSGEEMPGREIG